jgi:hypothetical protein
VKYPKGINKNVWDKMVNYTKDWGYMILFLAVFCIIMLMLKDVIRVS